MEIPPPLSWLTSFTESLERATGSKILLGLAQTVNPLLYKVTLHWSEVPSPKVAQGTWNIFETFAAKNDCVLEGKTERSPFKMVFHVIVKRRRGPDREDVP